MKQRADRPTATAARITASSAARRRKRCAWSSAARTSGRALSTSPTRWPRPRFNARPLLVGLDRLRRAGHVQAPGGAAALGDQASGGSRSFRLKIARGSRLKSWRRGRPRS